MSLKDCISSAVEQGHITLEEGEALKKRYDTIAKKVLSKGEAKRQFEAEIAAEATDKKRRALLTETARQQADRDLDTHRNHKGEIDKAEAFMWMHEHYGEAKFKDAEHGKQAILSEAHTKMNNVLHEFRRGALTGDLKRTSKLIGNAKTQARMANVVRVLFGEGGDVGPAAKALADAWTGVAEDLRVRFNAAGGSIQKLENWGLPQSHDPEALLNVGKAKWIEYMMKPDVLSRDKTVHPLTREPMTDAELAQSLSVVWDRITTDGFSDAPITGVATGRGAAWKQHAEHRFLFFKSSESWLKYAKEFGNPDPFGAMMGHINMMARDIAHMERFGPNPEVVRQYLKNRIVAEAAQVKSNEVVRAEQGLVLKDIASRLSKPDPDYTATAERISQVHVEMDAIRSRYRPQLGGKPSVRDKFKLEKLTAELNALEDKIIPYRTGEKPLTIEDTAVAVELQQHLDLMRDEIATPDRSDPVGYARSKLNRADDMWAAMTGALNSPINVKWANRLAVARNLITASSLGSAVLSAISDAGFGAVRKGFVGASKNSFNAVGVIKDTIRFIGPENRMEAVRSGLILDSAIHLLHAQAKYVGSVDTKTISGFLADRVVSLQGLNAWTQAGKHAFGMALQGMFADHAGTVWRELPSAVRDTLDRHGFTAQTWDQIRQVKLYEPKTDAKFLRPNEIREQLGEQGRDLGDKYVMMLLRETRFAVPEATVRSRSIVTNTKPGTIPGELARSFSQFKGFGVAVVMMHMGQVARDLGAGNTTRAASYAGALFITSTLLGAFAMAMKDIAAGRDPRRWTSDDTFLDPLFWGAATLQAGGQGILGDFLFSNLNRMGGGLAGTVAGPLWGRIDNIRDMTLGNAQQLMQGKKTNFGREAIKFARQNTPGGSLWFARLAYERMILDQLQILVDKDAHSEFRKQVQSRRKEYRQDFWWQPGDVTPKRGPRLNAMFDKP